MLAGRVITKFTNGACERRESDMCEPKAKSAVVDIDEMKLYDDGVAENLALEFREK